MAYKLGQRVVPKFRGLRLAKLVLSAILVTGAMATAYANSNNAGSPAGSLLAGKSAKSGATLMKSSKTTTASTGNAANKISAQTLTSIAPVVGLRAASCDLFPPGHQGLASAASPELRKLAQYEQVCNGALASRSSFFVTTPTTTAAAQSDASDTTARLKEYASFGIKPLVFMEPATAGGANIDLGLYQSGAYDMALDAYFSNLKADGVTDAMMGMWVALPEGNIPVWTSVDPATYAADVTKTIQFQKKYFPASQATILLDSETYPTGASWGGGQYVSLLPYVQSIPKGLVDSFGLQGFPWAPPANQAGEAASYNPTAYLRADFAAEAARALGVTSIWFNTGTFYQMYTQNSAQTVTASPTERQAMLDGTIAQAKKLQAKGFSVSIHLFAQNKANTSEATDWSYWKGLPGSDPNTAVFTTFARDSASAHIPLWLFDSDSN